MLNVLPHVTRTTPASSEYEALPNIPVSATMKKANWPSQSRMNSQDQRGANRPLGKVSKNAARQGNSTKKLIPEMVKAICKKGLGNTETPSKTPVMPVNAIVMKINEVSSPSSRSEEHTSELQSQSNLVCRLLLEKKKEIDIPCRMKQ